MSSRWRNFLPGVLVIVVFFSTRAHSEITKAIEVRSLSYAEAEAGQPVEITGVVIFSDPPNTVFIQDETAGTFFRLGSNAAPPAGTEVKVSGRTYPGLYVPGIQQAVFEVLGEKGRPDPVVAGYDDLLSGRFHYQWVEIEGIVRSFSNQIEGRTVVRIAIESEIVEVHVEADVPGDTRLVDRLVKVRGLAAGRINQRRQLVEPYLRARSWENFEFVKEKMTAPSLAEPTPMKEFLTFRVDGTPRHRHRIRGVIIANFPDGHLYLRSGDDAMLAEMQKFRPELTVGQTVDVIGFPEMKRYSAGLVNARLQQRVEPAAFSVKIPISSDADGESVPPKTLGVAPVKLTVGELFEGAFDSNLVQIGGQLTDVFRNETGDTVLQIREDGKTVRAEMAGVSEPPAVGSEIVVTGVCIVENTSGSEYRSTPSSIRMRLRGPADLAIVKSPNWWTPQKLVIALAALGFMMLLGALWIFLLRRQVRAQTRILRSRIETEAAMMERQRLAREFHDTLEQDLAGLSLRLDAATALPDPDSKIAGFLEGSRNLVGRIQSETRNLVADLRGTRDGVADLSATLREMIDELPKEVGPDIQLTVQDMAPLPARTVHHLKMIVREAITNAIKHASAEEIVVAAQIENGVLQLGIADDGCGLDARKETFGKTGHFGCMGIRERARKLGATVDWKPRENGGTIVALELPPEKND